MPPSIASMHYTTLIALIVRRIARVYGREQASRAYIIGESIEEEDMVMSIGNSLSIGDEPIGEEGL